MPPQMITSGTKKLQWQILRRSLALALALFTVQAGLFAQARTAAVPATAPASSTGTAPLATQAPGHVAAPANSRAAANVPAAPKNFFHVKYISEGAVYLDAGRNAGLQEGMLLHVVHCDADGGTTDSVRFQGQESLADVRIFSVADTSSAAELVKPADDLVPGDIAYLDIVSVHARTDKTNAIESENYPVVVTFSYGDPLDEEIRASKSPVSTTAGDNRIRGRFGFDFGNLSEPGGFNSRQIGLLVQADIDRKS